MTEPLSSTDMATDARLELFRQMEIVLEGERVLEFGTRDGALAALIESQGNEVTAIGADLAALTALTPTFDRFVAVGVLEKLAEARVSQVLAEAARLAAGVLIVVATDASGAGSTLRPAVWWVALLASHFDVQAIDGIEPGQLILTGDRRAPVSSRIVAEVTSETMADAIDLGLPATYVARAVPEPRLSGNEGGVVWQPDVYPTAANIARSLDCDTLIDIGCDQFRQLGTLSPEFRLIGLGREASTAAAAEMVPAGIWLEVDVENLDLSAIPAEVLTRSVIVCSELIQCLVDPRSLLAALRQLLEHAPALVLSTTDRERTYGTEHQGPPPNTSHVRQWSMTELRALLEREGFSLAAATHTRSHDRSQEAATTLIVAVNPDHPAMTSSQHGRKAQAAPASLSAVRKLPELLIGDVQSAVQAAGNQAMSHPQWRERLGRARDDRETLRLLARMSLALGHPDRSMELYGALLSIDGGDHDALEGVVLSRMRCGQHGEAARILRS